MGGGGERGCEFIGPGGRVGSSGLCFLEKLRRMMIVVLTPYGFPLDGVTPGRRAQDPVQMDGDGTGDSVRG